MYVPIVLDVGGFVVGTGVGERVVATGVGERVVGTGVVATGVGERVVGTGVVGTVGIVGRGVGLGVGFSLIVAHNKKE